MHEMEHLEQPINPMIRLICCDGFWQSEIIGMRIVHIFFCLKQQQQPTHARIRENSQFSLLLAAS